MTSTPELNISGSPIYEHLVASSGDPYQPPGYQLPARYEPPEAQGAGYGHGYGPQYAAEHGAPAYAYGNPAMLSQFLNQILGDGQSWVAVVVFGGPMADQLRQSQQYQQFPQQQMPQPFWPAPATGYADAPSFGAMSAEQTALAQAYQAYQQMMMYQWAAQQQAAAQQTVAPQSVAAQAMAQAMPQYAMTAGQQPLALTAGPPPATDPVGQPAPEPLDGMLTQDWAGWLGQTSQSARPPERAQDEYQDEREDRYEPSYERRGGSLTSRLGAAMRELRGR